MDEELPHLLQWTHFAKGTALMDANMQYVPESESGLQKFTDTTGVPGNSLLNGKSMEDKLPHTSPWSHFARNVSWPEGGQGGTHGCN